MIVTTLFHFTVDGTCYNVTRSKRKAWVIFLHKLFTSHVTQHGTVPAHSLCYQETGAVSRMIKGSWMELDKFHILYETLGAVYHSNSVSGSNQWISSITVNGTYATRSHERCFRKESVYFACIFIQYIGSIALDTRGMAGYNNPHVMLCDDFYGKMAVEYLNVRMRLYSSDEAFLYFGACIVFMMQDTEFRVSAFFM